MTANKELEAFSYSVSHDLRSPLGSINGFARILMAEYAPNLDEEGIRLCTIIIENSTKMGNLIDDLLSFSRLGRVLMQKNEVNMREMADSVFVELTANEEKSRIDFQISDICNSEGDAILLKQVWLNLLQMQSNTVPGKKRP